ncbi:MAG: D-alanyl-D-alanine carboxypeptidase, partial [Bacteroidota bacterium]
MPTAGQRFVFSAWLVFMALLMAVSGCAPYRKLERDIRQAAAERNHHSGFVLYDPLTRKVLADVNGDRYFTPASNTKILTLYAGMTMLGDSVPVLRYRVNGDSLIFTGTGDPSLLNPDTYASNSVISLLSNFNGTLYLAPAATAPERYGPGWAWDDFDAYYQPERSAFPIYGNTIRVNGRKVVPALFTDSVRWLADAPVARDVSVNRFNIDSTRKKSVTIPFRTSD